MSALVARRSRPGTLSARKPGDLRTDAAPRPAGITEDIAVKATAVVRSRAGTATDDVLAMLGLAVAS